MTSGPSFSCLFRRQAYKPSLCQEGAILQKVERAWKREWRTHVWAAQNLPELLLPFSTASIHRLSSYFDFFPWKENFRCAVKLNTIFLMENIKDVQRSQTAKIQKSHRDRRRPPPGPAPATTSELAWGAAEAPPLSLGQSRVCLVGFTSHHPGFQRVLSTSGLGLRLKYQKRSWAQVSQEDRRCWAMISLLHTYDKLNILSRLSQEITII